MGNRVNSLDEKLGVPGVHPLWKPGAALTANRLSALTSFVNGVKQRLSTIDTTYRPNGRTAEGSTWQWAKVTATQPTLGTFTARLVDSSGNMTGSDLTVTVMATNQNGAVLDGIDFQANVTVPRIAVDYIVRIEYRSGYRPGWKTHDLHYMTCV